MSGRGWMPALREMQGGAAAHRGARRAHAAVPSWQRTEAGAQRHALRPFPALECPQRHGHLHSHSGMLAERGLVRSLLGPERRRWRRTAHAALLELRRGCDGSSEDCSYCASAAGGDRPAAPGARAAPAPRQWSDHRRPRACRWLAVPGLRPPLDPQPRGGLRLVRPRGGGAVAARHHAAAWPLEHELRGRTGGAAVSPQACTRAATGGHGLGMLIACGVLGPAPRPGPSLDLAVAVGCSCCCGCSGADEGVRTAHHA